MIEILYQDSHIVVCLKPPGVISQEGGEDSMPQLLSKQLEVKSVYPIHRLDRAVGGVMVYALTQASAAVLSRAVQERKLEKTYLAVLQGVPEEAAAELEDLLFHDKSKNKTYVVKRMRKGVKDAKLSYEVLESTGERTLIRVKLYTGRTHQIRVQFAHRKLPLAGDGRYGGSREKELGLWSYRIAFLHPTKAEPMEFSRLPANMVPWDIFEYIKKESNYD